MREESYRILPNWTDAELEARTTRMLTSRDIRWTSSPVDRIEDCDVLGLTFDELFAYVAALQHECRWLRRLDHEAVHGLAARDEEIERQRRQLAGQRDEIRRFIAGEEWAAL